MSKKTTEVKEVKEVEVKEAEVKKVDLTPILKAIPETFTPAYLDKAFNLNDGGKTVRRHLRKHFAVELEHNKKDKWTFTKAQTQIIGYFAERYIFNPDAVAINQEAKA